MVWVRDPLYTPYSFSFSFILSFLPSPQPTHLPPPFLLILLDHSRVQRGERLDLFVQGRLPIHLPFHHTL